MKFTGTATAGFDHVDKARLAEQGIGFSSAPGCNAIAVVEYVFSALMLLAERDSFQLADKTVGIIGAGMSAAVWRSVWKHWVLIFSSVTRRVRITVMRGIL